MASLAVKVCVWSVAWIPAVLLSTSICGAALGPAATELMPPDIVGKNPDWSPFVRCTLFLIGCMSGTFPTQDLFLTSGTRSPVNLQQPFQLLWTVWQGRLIGHFGPNGMGKHWRVFQMVEHADFCPGSSVFQMVEHADFCPGSGTMQGDGPSAELFLEPYHPQLDFWANDVAVNDPRQSLVATCRFLFGEDKQDLSMATFADDISRISLGQTSADLCLALQVANASLDRRLWEIELVQNIQKQEHVVYFGGSGSQQHYETVYGDSYLPGQTVQSAGCSGLLRRK